MTGLSDHIEIGDLLAHGIREVEAHCAECGHRWSVPVGFLPERTTLRRTTALLCCQNCEFEGVVVVVPSVMAGSRHA